MDDFYLAQKIVGFFLLGIKNCYTFCRVQGGRDPSKLLFSVSPSQLRIPYEIHRGDLFFLIHQRLGQGRSTPLLKHFGNKHAISLGPSTKKNRGWWPATFLGYHCCWGGGAEVLWELPWKMMIPKDTQEVNAASSWHGTGGQEVNWT